MLYLEAALQTPEKAFMELTLTTPALLFPATSLVLLAYTNRCHTLANLVRELHRNNKANPEDLALAQISNLRYRIVLLRDMQACGIGGFFLCMLWMLVLFFGQVVVAKIIFGASLILLIISLGISMREILASIDALRYRLSDLVSSQPHSSTNVQSMSGS
jgi:dolichol kinase